MKLIPQFALTIMILSLSSCKKEETPIEDTTVPKEEEVIDDRTPYLGTYTVTDSLFMFGVFEQLTTYQLEVTTGGTSKDTLYLGNLWNEGAAYHALLNGSTFTIPSQHVDGPYYTEGSGQFNGDQISYETSGDVYLHKGSGVK